MNFAEEQLIKLMQSWPKEIFEEFRQHLIVKSEEFRWLLKEIGPIEFMKEFYEAYDDATLHDQTLTSCSRGCHFCCRQNVTVWKAEAGLIAKYCREKEIAIPKDYLKAQLRHGEKEVARSEVGWCVFLKGGECSIYPVRPSACRNYYVVSKPELCDIVAFPPGEGKVVVKIKTGPLIFKIALDGIMAEQEKSRGGRMPEMLLPYVK